MTPEEKEAIKKIAAPFLNFLLVESRFNLATKRAVLEALKNQPLDVEKTYDAIHDAIATREADEYDALEKVHYLLFHNKGGGSEYDFREWVEKQRRRRMKIRREKLMKGEKL